MVEVTLKLWLESPPQGTETWEELWKFFKGAEISKGLEVIDVGIKLRSYEPEKAAEFRAKLEAQKQKAQGVK